ncbi:hypothetical protein BW687_020850 [Pseudomonas graminis]|nr:hypothetical protein [Pseudomonas graminis]MDC6382616.1 hypothetical protein [Pseudomonas graminis]
MLPSLSTELFSAADGSRLAERAAAWNATTSNAPASYFYGYWFSHWRA